jgi:hypothetical protein
MDLLCLWTSRRAGRRFRGELRPGKVSYERLLMVMAHDCNESYLVYVSVVSLFGAMGIPYQAAALSDS